MFNEKNSYGKLKGYTFIMLILEAVKVLFGGLIVGLLSFILGPFALIGVIFFIMPIIKTAVLLYNLYCIHNNLVPGKTIYYVLMVLAAIDFIASPGFISAIVNGSYILLSYLSLTEIENINKNENNLF